jgi:hypothetical protein
MAKDRWVRATTNTRHKVIARINDVLDRDALLNLIRTPSLFGVTA